MRTTNGLAYFQFSRARMWFVLACSVAVSTGCSPRPENGASTSVVPIIAASISVQPLNQNIPMGLSATFAVTASGSSLQYQWSKNGTAIEGAHSNSYTTPPTTFADIGSTFLVTVYNSAGIVASNVALLTVTARAPMPGDLRFEQVDSLSTVNGWGNAGVGLDTILLARSAQYFSPSIGTPFYVGSAGNCGTPQPVSEGTGCTWAFTVVPFRVSSSDPTLLAGFGSDSFGNFRSDLQDRSWPSFGNGASPAFASSVINSLDLEPANALFAVAWIQSVRQTSFEPVLNTVTAANIAAAATQEGESGRVITAISNNAGEITYIAYGWEDDTATLYEAKVVRSSATDAPTAAASLAAQGFIITASGLADSSGNIIFIGTRVQGDTMARPFVAAQGTSAVQAMMLAGYANIGVIVDSSNPNDPYTYLGER